jgi:hypothetical protein
VQHAQPARGEIGERVRDGLQGPVGQGDRQGVDREVAPAEVLGHRGAELHLGERPGRAVALAAGRREVERDAPDADRRGPEALVRRQLPAQAPGERDRVALHQQVHLARLAAEQHVADRAARHVDPGLARDERDRGQGAEPAEEIRGIHAPVPLQSMSPDAPRSRRRLVAAIGAAVALLVLAGGAAAFLLTRDDDVVNEDVGFTAEPTQTPFPPRRRRRPRDGAAPRRRSRGRTTATPRTGAATSRPARRCAPRSAAPGRSGARSCSSSAR